MYLNILGNERRLSPLIRGDGLIFKSSRSIHRFTTHLWSVSETKTIAMLGVLPKIIIVAHDPPARNFQSIRCLPEIRVRTALDFSHRIDLPSMSH